MKSFLMRYVIGVVFLPVFLYSQSISVSGQWDLVVGVGDLPTGTPGENLNSNYENTAGNVTLSLGTGGGFFNWRDYRVDVRRNDTLWEMAWTLSVRRTSGGTVWGSISGGTTYQAITSVDQQFFTGRCWFAYNLPLQYRLTGVSATQVAQTYSTTVVYTLTVW
ncbi:MAG TPA: hypothetical protein ENN17_09390 [bacterium]|nr:hypothetical protein [bacterium]